MLAVSPASPRCAGVSRDYAGGTREGREQRFKARRGREVAAYLRKGQTGSRSSLARVADWTPLLYPFLYLTPLSNSPHPSLPSLPILPFPPCFPCSFPPLCPLLSLLSTLSYNLTPPCPIPSPFFPLSPLCLTPFSNPPISPRNSPSLHPCPALCRHPPGSPDGWTSGNPLPRTSASPSPPFATPHSLPFYSLPSSHCLRSCTLSLPSTPPPSLASPSSLGPHPFLAASTPSIASPGNQSSGPQSSVPPVTAVNAAPSTSPAAHSFFFAAYP
ncbi:unnamed protein product [Closterium sp. Naga37s-1]|nr:unnamed protein product [Closterium sp. Naga37s-1]